MPHHPRLLAVFASLAVGSTACEHLECPDGTIERDGVCAGPDGEVETDLCGKGTLLYGDQCVPEFPPTMCDPDTTTPVFDPDTGITTCVGSVDGGGCGFPINCPAGTNANHLTVCGQLYDFEDNTRFEKGATLGARCNPAAPASSGPCALQIHAFDAIAFATNPSAAPELPVGDVFIDECGRYRLRDIDVNGTGPFISLAIDDAGMPFGPAGVTVTVGVATSKPSQRYVRDFEAWIVKSSTTDMWQQSGGPPLAGGIYAALFRAHKKGNGDPFAPQTHVSITKSGAVQTANDHYFVASEQTKKTIDMNASVTGMNGTALYTGASVDDNVVYAGQGGLSVSCRWEPHAAASPAGVVFIQVYRKLDVVGMTCYE